MMFDVEMAEKMNDEGQNEYEFNAISDNGREYMTKRFGQAVVGFSCEPKYLGFNVRQMNGYGLNIYSA